MDSHYPKIAPPGHPILPPQMVAGYTPKEPLADWEILFQLNALVEQRARHIAREEFEILLAKHIASTAEADSNEQLITVAQAAEMFEVIPQTVYGWIKAGKIPSFTIGSRSVRLKRGDVLAALQVSIQPDGRRKYARRTNGVAKQKRNSIADTNVGGKEVAYA
jgi:excisionase family DNA binding protein